ncbi:DUF1996 domain-containing protein [Streptomyces sp. NPDC048566]|uniref:DUF1996 domain-containing protein n=1 Tax=Streptomyces sp. NPDC048566 TaxID=3365569 RepID=UPI00371D33C4
MRRNTRKRPTGARRATLTAVALILGGGTLVAANVYASATESPSDGADQPAASGAATISCPDVGQKLSDVPDEARAEVDKELANLDKQIAEAYTRLTSSSQAQTQDPGFVQNAILGPLKDKRAAVIDRIQLDLKRVGAQAPDALDDLAACEQGNGAQDQAGEGGNGEGGQDGSGGTAAPGTGQNDNGNGAAGPVAADFVDITTVQPNVPGKPAASGDASTGTFSVECGVNENKLYNTDNIIVAPGVGNGAHHTHDYVGNQGVDAFSSNDKLAASETSCSEQGDKSSYYWPVLRLQDGTKEFDAGRPGGGGEGNVGRILQAAKADITYVGSPQGQVVAMPKFLRIITGDAKAFTNGTANANAHWSCTGFEDKVQLTDKYPICPGGSDVVRSYAFQSCWDGQNIDSANHRTHVAFADAEGRCQNGFKAIPQLTMRLVYDVPAPVVENGQVKNPFAVDGFPEQLHKAITDHDDFISVMDDKLMNSMVDCINGGRTCGAGADAGSGGADDGADAGAGSGSGSGATVEPKASVPPTAGSGHGGYQGGAKPGATRTSAGSGGKHGTDSGNAGTGNTGTVKDDKGDKDDKGGATAAPASSATPPATQKAEQNDALVKTDDDSADEQADDSADTADTAATPAAEGTPSAAGAPSTGGGDVSDAGAQTEPQTVTGGLAETGASLWPALAGGALALAGVVLLIRSRRRTV